jgi:hypothetical protein
MLEWENGIYIGSKNISLFDRFEDDRMPVNALIADIILSTCYFKNNTVQYNTIRYNTIQYNTKSKLTSSGNARNSTHEAITASTLLPVKMKMQETMQDRKTSGAVMMYGPYIIAS